MILHRLYAYWMRNASNRNIPATPFCPRRQQHRRRRGEAIRMRAGQKQQQQQQKHVTVTRKSPHRPSYTKCRATPNSDGPIQSDKRNGRNYRAPWICFRLSNEFRFGVPFARCSARTLSLAFTPSRLCCVIHSIVELCTFIHHMLLLKILEWHVHVFQ